MLSQVFKKIAILNIKTSFRVPQQSDRLLDMMSVVTLQPDIGRKVTEVNKTHVNPMPFQRYSPLAESCISLAQGVFQN